MKRKIALAVTIGVALSLASCNVTSKQGSDTMKMQSEVMGNGSPIVLVPGGLTGWASWEPFVEGFSKDRTVIRVQLLGVQFGLENRPLPEDYSVKMESGALAATLDALGYQMPVDVVAWSYGAFTALDYALDNPDRIRTLTLIEPPAMWVLRATGKWNQEAQEMAEFSRSFQDEVTEDMLAEFLKNAGFVQPGQSARELLQWDHWVPFRRSLRINPYTVTHQDEVGRLKSFQSPTMLVKGTGSSPFLHQIIDGLSEHIPHSTVVEFPGGHAPHLVSRDSFLVELERFQSHVTQQ
ncbi:alpha/beta fold hydrolase [Negadavirga shengliensis]|uniref:Alpha/beta fold hydrolase n=1 Tax=Negadavirga shengliensis TaxID=1389218 RepID=A0ABV9T8E9_9BACT